MASAAEITQSCASLQPITVTSWSTSIIDLMTLIAAPAARGGTMVNQVHIVLPLPHTAYRPVVCENFYEMLGECRRLGRAGIEVVAVLTPDLKLAEFVGDGIVENRCVTFGFKVAMAYCRLGWTVSRLAYAGRQNVLYSSLADKPYLCHDNGKSEVYLPNEESRKALDWFVV